MTLYHATYSHYVDSILATGLGGPAAAEHPNWDDSKGDRVYLAESADIALSYAESSDLVPDSWLVDIVIRFTEKPRRSGRGCKVRSLAFN